jgi:peptidoglycan/LPS O-acetylase OafA/YrhL
VTPRRALAVMLGVIVVVAGLQWAPPPGGGALGLAYTIVTNVPLAICFGVVLAHLLHHRRGHEGLRWLFGWRASSLVFAALLLWVLGSGRSDLAVHLSAALLVGACVYREDHWLARLLRWRVLAFVGSVSYGVYLLHMLVKNVVVKALAHTALPSSNALVFVLTAAGAIAVAAISFRYFESYFLRRKARYAVRV